MKAESNVMPQQPYTVDIRGAEADVTFFANPIETERDGETVWEYDTYTLTVDDRPGLEAVIEDTYEDWLVYAMEQEAYEAEPPTLEDRVAAIEAIELEKLLGGEF